MTQGVQAQSKLPLRSVLGVELPLVEICDIGAMIEGKERFAALVDQNMANVSGFEPNPAEMAKLQARGAARHRYFPYFLGRGGPATFHITRYPGCCSLYEPDPAVIDLFTSIGATPPGGNFAVLRTEQVETTRLQDVPGMPVADYFKLDVQGAELDVLVGAGEALGQAVVIELEVEFVPLYKNQPLFGDVQVFLRGQGFVLHKFMDITGRSYRPYVLQGNPFAPMSQVLWADAVFVRDFSYLAGYTDEQLLKAALILYEVYCSYDLVHYLLREYDRRRKTVLAERFGQGMARQPGLPLIYMNFKLHP